MEPTPQPPEDRPAPTDDEGVRLMLAFQGGDEGAFADLVEAYSGRVYALLTRFLGAVDRREDLVQDVFMRVLRARERYQPTARFSTWLYRITFNLATNERARQAPRRHLSLDRGMGDEDEGATLGERVEDHRGESPDETLERMDVVDAVRAAIDALPERQRMALVLAKYDELPYAEIAEVLETSEKAIKSMVHRARENLRELLGPFLQEEVA